MDKQKFQETFSHIHASERLKTEVLQMKRKERRNARRILRGVLVAACLLALIAATIIAAPKLYKNRGHVVTDEGLWATPTDADGNSDVMHQHKVYLDFDLRQEAPKRITRFYLPQIPEDYVQYHGYLYKDNMLVQYRWKAPDSYENDIAFYQEAGGSVDLTECVDVVWTEPEKKPETNFSTLGSIDGYLIDSAPVGELSGHRVFYWTDGDYLFRLEAPYSYTDEQLSALVESVQELSHVRPYLIGMTEAEKDAALPPIP